MTIIISLIAFIVVFILCRELICWYYKINTIVELMEEQNELLRKVLVRENGLENSKENRNPEKVKDELPQPEVQISDEVLMKRYSISFENEQYIYSGYKYDRLKDAVNYARIQEKNSK